MYFSHTSNAQQFFNKCHSAEEKLKQHEENLNNQFSQTEFRLDEGEILLKKMQQLKDELSHYESEVQHLIEVAGEIVPLRARTQKIKQPLEAVAICKLRSAKVRPCFISISGTFASNPSDILTNYL